MPAEACQGDQSICIPYPIRAGVVSIESTSSCPRECHRPGCSMLRPEKWYDLFGDPTIADASLDRIVHKSHVIQLKGESIRKLKFKKA